MAMNVLPLNALRAFEVAARHGSYTRAAEELRLTHSAVSHQMRLLSEELGVVLFEREGRGMRLTPVGEALARDVRDGFDRLASACAQARRSTQPGPITVSAVSAFTARWLVPRLHRFHALHPEVEVSLRVTDVLANFRTDGVDVGIRFGAGVWPGLTAIELMRERTFPVCSPALLRGRRVKRPSDLARLPLLRHAYLPWVPWFRSVGLDWPEPSRGTIYDDSNTALRAAAEGLGVTLARAALAEDDLEKGRLVRLFPNTVSLPGEWGYYVVYPGKGDPPPHVAPFVAWLVAEARAERAPATPPPRATAKRATPERAARGPRARRDTQR